ncbi:MAG: T9SS type A sorting domain-containing protein [Bacteroidota bacterium]
MKNKSTLSNRTQIKPLASALATGGLILLAGLFFYTTSSIPEISGVINDYAKVTSVSGDDVTVDDASNFTVGDKVLIIQMKGAVISEVDDTTYGDVTSWGSAGEYEFNYIKAKNSNDLTLNHELCKTYDPSHTVQLVRVPEYDSVRITGELNPAPWDGTKGGVLALAANYKVRVAADLVASAKGFEGGSFNGSARGRSLTYTCALGSGMGGAKGEGIVEVALTGCRGKLANGGGGGNDHNGGGGGGGNYGEGGMGGDGWKSNSAGNLSDLDKGGRGGLSLQNLYEDGVPRLFMGGGGGGGHQNNGASFPGGTGGGIIMVISPVVHMETAQAVNASGEDAQDITINDGSSGGGGGGSILLDVDRVINPDLLTLSVSGGDGADIRTADQHGPGGGGGGGIINSTTLLSDSIVYEVNGGVAGLFISTRSSHVYHNTPHGASSGADGAILHNLVIQKCSNPPTIDLNGSDSGTDYDTEFYPAGPDQEFILGEVAISDDDDTEMGSATIEIINPVDGSDEYLRMGDSFDENGNISANRGGDGHSISLVGQAPIADYLNAIKSIVYNDTSATYDDQPRMISVEVDDGGATSNSAMVTLNFSNTEFPVEWLYFQVEAAGSAAKLEWGTAIETNSHYFDVERSFDGKQFDPIGQVQAAGNSSTVKDYQFSDPNVLEAEGNEVIYRLRQVDMDGQFEYSSLVSLNMEDLKSESTQLKVANPVTGGSMQISLINTPESGGKLSLYSVNGQLIKSQRVSQSNLQQINIEVGTLNSGIYILNYKFGQRQISKKIKIQN